MKRRRVGVIASVVVFSLMIIFAGQSFGAGICVKDQLGEEIHLDVHPGGLLTGYSSFNGVVTGTAIGSFKVLSDHEVMLGGDINNDRKSGLLPGKFNGTIDVVQMTGAATGFLFYTDGTNAILFPFESALFPCGDTPGQPANWGAFFER